MKNSINNDNYMKSIQRQSIYIILVRNYSQSY